MSFDELSWLSETYAGNTIARWLLGILVWLGSYVAIRTGMSLLRRALARQDRRHAVGVASLAHGFVRSSKIWLVFLATVSLALLVVRLPEGWNRYPRGVAIVAMLLQAGFWSASLAAALVSRAIARRATDPADPAARTGETLLKMVASVTVWVLVLLLVLANLGVDINALVAGLGIGGLAVALALQTVLSDLLASVSILLDEPFRAGDFIVVGEYAGTVERIGLKTTRVRSLGGEQMIMSNNDLLQGRLRNYKRMQERRILFKIGVTYDTPAAKLEQLSTWVRTLIEARAGTRFDRCHFASYGDFALIYEIVYFVLSPDYNVYMDHQQAINLAIYRKLEAEGVAFAYRTQTLYVHKEA